MISYSEFKEPGSIQINYSGDYARLLLKPGLYTFELWGACGGDDAGDDGGRGGYTKAVFDYGVKSPFPDNEIWNTVYCSQQLENIYLYIYCGGQGKSQQIGKGGGWNGGGNAGPAGNSGGGGGATDIRINSTSIYARAVVAGGGGGGGEHTKPTVNPATQEKIMTVIRSIKDSTLLVMAAEAAVDFMEAGRDMTVAQTGRVERSLHMAVPVMLG